MSEEILKALAQLFAIISKQDEGVSETERAFVINFFKQELEMQSVPEYIALYDKFAGYGQDEESLDDTKRKKEKKDRVNVVESVRVLGICRKINKTLNQKQKVIVLLKLLELLASDRAFTTQRMEIINTVSTVFNIPPNEYKLIESFIVETHSSKIDSEDILIFDDERPPEGSKIKFIDSGLLDGEIIFVRVKSVGLYFTKYTGDDEIFLNSQRVNRNLVFQFAPGSIIKTPKGAPLYYSDLVNRYNADLKYDNISFNATDIEFRFPSGHVGLRDVSISEGPGQLIGIMGASGAGKTTLLNVLSGLEKPSKGSITINGFDIFTQKDKIEGVIGYISQDDLLIEELTVFQNLYYNAKLCFKNLSEAEINKKVSDVLQSLGLDRITHLKVGSPLNKKISGGQRKRLNIALELIREPAVMFVDEPTSGLSSRDSENVIDLLKELSLKGKLIFVVIHQPSSDIYKMFDKMFLLDTGGFPIFYGNPIEAVIYFKTATQQVGSERGQCGTCGNVNPEQLFNIIEAKVVDEYGEFTDKRKVTPPEWYKLYKERFEFQKAEDIQDAPPTTLNIPSRIKQASIFATRDFLSKISDTQYLLVNLLEAPFLALLLSLVIKYTANEADGYVFRYNDNVPAYILIAIIVAIFMGLSVSAEEIISDRKILKREAFLNLSRSSYLVSKILILFVLSAVQTLAFVLIGNTILGIEGLNFVYWAVLFTVSCHANVLGLNVSSAFNSAITVYILIPILLIPQMILSGLIFDFDKLNNSITEEGKVPFLADLMASRWGYEAIAVEQFRSNRYQHRLFEIELEESHSNYRANYWAPRMEDLAGQAVVLYQEGINDSTRAELATRLKTLSNELGKDAVAQNSGFDYTRLVTTSVFDDEKGYELMEFIQSIKDYHYNVINKTGEARDSVLALANANLPEGVDVNLLKNRYFNDKLADLVKANNASDRIIEKNNRLIQIMDPVFHVPEIVPNPLNYRAHFFAPVKHLFGKHHDTLFFNLAAVWLMTLVLYITLYFELLAKLLSYLGRLFGKLAKGNN